MRMRLPLDYRKIRPKVACPVGAALVVIEAE
jgi:hypothetical protein